MFDFLRDRGSTAEDKRQEALNAYLDNALTPAERERFEGEMARDGDMRAEVERMRLLKLQMRTMPRRRVPRSFALDPALYGRPKAQPMMQLYPVLRGATALTALVFVLTLALGFFQGPLAGGGIGAPVTTEISMSQAVEEEAAPAEMAGEAASLAVPEAAGEDERVMPTAAAESAQLATEPLTDTFSIEALPPVAGTALPGAEMTATAMPGGDLGFEPAAAPELTTEEAAIAGTMEDQVVGIPQGEVEETGAADAIDTATPLFGPIQIAAGIAFLLLLILWLLARQRVRNF